MATRKKNSTAAKIRKAVQQNMQKSGTKLTPAEEAHRILGVARCKS